MSWILFFVELYWIESGVDYHRRVELWVEPSVLLSASGNRELNRFWGLIINDLIWIESTWILVNPSELWIMKEVAVRITVVDVQYPCVFVLRSIVLTVIKSTVKSLAIVRSSCVMSVSVCPNVSMSRYSCRVAYGKSSSHRVFSLELRISCYKLQYTLF